MLDSSTNVPTLIIVGGLSAVGKTTLARRLAAHFTVPLMHKDVIKESLYDVLGCEDIAESQRLGHASMVLLFQFAEAVLRTGQTCMIESTFHPGVSTQAILELQQHCPFRPLQIYCRAEISILIERWRRRRDAGERHPGHMERERGYSPAIPQEYLQPLPLGGHVIELDTTSFEMIDYEQLLSQISDVIGR